jgi:hypothetical protein
MPVFATSAWGDFTGSVDVKESCRPGRIRPGLLLPVRVTDECVRRYLIYADACSIKHGHVLSLLLNGYGLYAIPRGKAIM